MPAHPDQLGLLSPQLNGRTARVRTRMRIPPKDTNAMPLELWLDLEAGRG